MPLSLCVYFSFSIFQFWVSTHCDVTKSSDASAECWTTPRLCSGLRPLRPPSGFCLGPAKHLFLQEAVNTGLIRLFFFSCFFFWRGANIKKKPVFGNLGHKINIYTYIYFFLKKSFFKIIFRFLQPRFSADN